MFATLCCAADAHAGVVRDIARARDDVPVATRRTWTHMVASVSRTGVWTHVLSNVSLVSPRRRFHLDRNLVDDVFFVAAGRVVRSLSSMCGYRVSTAGGKTVQSSRPGVRILQ